jgi:hypothetical protein
VLAQLLRMGILRALLLRMGFLRALLLRMGDSPMRLLGVLRALRLLMEERLPGILRALALQAGDLQMRPSLATLPVLAQLLLFLSEAFLILGPGGDSKELGPEFFQFTSPNWAKGIIATWSAMGCEMPVQCMSVQDARTVVLYRIGLQNPFSVWGQDMRCMEVCNMSKTCEMAVRSSSMIHVPCVCMDTNFRSDLITSLFPMKGFEPGR